MRSRSVLRVLGATALLACACAPPLVVRTAPTKPLGETWGFAVYPMVFRFPVSGFHSYERARVIAESLSERTGRLVYGPGEFRVEAVDADDLRRGTNVLAALRFTRERRPEGLYGVRFIVEQAVTSAGLRAYDTAGNLAKASRQDDVEVTVRAQLLSFEERDVVLELSGTAHVDLFNADLDRDRFPDVTRLSARLVEALVARAGWEPVPRTDPGLRTIPVPNPALGFAFPGQASVRDELATLDALDQDARLLALHRQRDPEASRKRLRTYRAAAHGLVVLEANGPAAKAGLRPDDLVVSADGEALTGRHVLARHLATNGRTTLVVKRDGEDLTIPLALE